MQRANVDASQSTVSRSLTRLRERGLVKDADGGIAITKFGALTIDRFEDLRRDFHHCLAAEPILRELDGAVPFTKAILEEATVHISDPRVPDAPLQPLIELTNRARSIEAVAAMLHEAYLDVFRDRLTASELTATFVVDESVAAIAQREYDDRENLVETTDQLDYYVTDLDVPYSLMRIRTPEDDYTAVTVSTDETHGTIVSTNEDAWTWSASVFERNKAAGERA